MKNFVVNNETGDRLEITDENYDIVKAEVAKNPELYSVEEVEDYTDVAKQEASTMDQRIAEAQRQAQEEESAQESAPVRYAKSAALGVARAVLPYGMEEFEKTRKMTSAGTARDVATLPMRVLPVNRLAMLGAGAAGTGIDVGAQSQYGDIEAGRTGIVAGLNALPLVPKSVTSRLGSFLKERGKGQLYGSIVPKEKYTRTNPITKEKLEEVFLKEDKVPILTSEANALEEMKGYNLSELERKGLRRNEIAEESPEFVNVLEYDIDNQGKILAGALNDAREEIYSQMQSGTITADRGQAMLRELNQQDKKQASVFQAGRVDAKKATNLVTSLNKDARTFVTAKGEGTPKSEALRYWASAINRRIERDIPELREATKSMSVNMALEKPIEERLVKATTQQPTSGIFQFGQALKEPFITLARRPQGAQLKYNLGRTFAEGSPMISRLYRLGMYEMPNE